MNYGGWLGWQIDYLLYLQNLREVTHHIFDNFFLGITTFGEVTISIVIICLLYWIIDKKAGQYVLFCWISGFIINLILKAAACIYRPWILNPNVHPVPKAIPAATGYSFPSGHTAGVVSVFGSIAHYYKNNRGLQYLCWLIVLLVMFSRNYLGVHTPQDVIVSFFVTCFLLFEIWKLMNWIEADEPNGKRDIISALAIMLITVLTTLYVVYKPYPVHYLFGKILYVPTAMKYTALVKSGFVFGALSGWLIERRYINFNPKAGTVLEKIIRLGIGVTILDAIYLSTKILRHSSAPYSDICAFVQFGILGLFLTFIYPFIINLYQQYIVKKEK